MLATSFLRIVAVREHAPGQDVENDTAPAAVRSMEIRHFIQLRVASMLPWYHRGMQRLKYDGFKRSSLGKILAPQSFEAGLKSIDDFFPDEARRPKTTKDRRSEALAKIAPLVKFNNICRSAWKLSNPSQIRPKRPQRQIEPLRSVPADPRKREKSSLRLRYNPDELSGFSIHVISMDSSFQQRRW